MERSGLAAARTAMGSIMSTSLLRLWGGGSPNRFSGFEAICAAFAGRISVQLDHQSFHLGPPAKGFCGVAGLLFARSRSQAAQHQVARHRPAPGIATEEVHGIVQRPNTDRWRSGQLQRRCEHKCHVAAQTRGSAALESVRGSGSGADPPGRLRSRQRRSGRVERAHRPEHFHRNAPTPIIFDRRETL
jgi:hypothetical protein